ncbi:TetR/AcrR family transcriptional regulator [Pseudonocardia acaciae]|uniref:TetR/AcrR family transcriptional regulator n=1 Tax=Pseudonocardia acaciae TaxID=551276 RepID=UPI00068676DA|nr:TetR/AcrR family transcriptional regulator [Pseudonocardia acaciae]
MPSPRDYGPWSVSSTPLEPPTLGRPAPPRERSDAARNRRRILDAAAWLFAEHGVDAVSLDAVAAEAGVGKGTVFRRFGDKSGLAAALLDERERELQEAMLAGPPPLGPGAGPAARVVAFVRAYLDYVLGAPELVRMSETASSGARFRLGAFGFWHTHLRILLERAGHPPARAVVLAHALLGPLAAEHLLAQLDAGVSREQLIDGLARHAELVACDSSACDMSQR